MADHGYAVPMGGVGQPALPGAEPLALRPRVAPRWSVANPQARRLKQKLRRDGEHAD